MLLIGKYDPAQIIQYKSCHRITRILFTASVLAVCVHNSMLLMHQGLCFDTLKCYLGSDLLLCVLSCHVKKLWVANVPCKTN